MMFSTAPITRSSTVLLPSNFFRFLGTRIELPQSTPIEILCGYWRFPPPRHTVYRQPCSLEEPHAAVTVCDGVDTEAGSMGSHLAVIWPSSRSVS